MSLNAKEKQQIKLKIVKRLSEWSMSTTSHGIPQIVQAKKFYVKVVWAVFLLASIALCAIMVITSVQDFLRFEVTTKIRDKTYDQLTFPTVTICNTNPFVTEDASTFLRNVMTRRTNISSYFDDGDDDFGHLVNLSDPTKISSIMYLTNHPKFNQTLKRSFNYWPERLYKFRFLNIDQDVSTNLSWYYHPLYGNCYRFNSGYDLNGNRVEVLSTGQEQFGFGVEMFIGPSGKYFQGQSNGFANGVVVFIDNQDEYQLYAEQGIFIPPSSYASISVSRIDTKTMHYPYSDCEDNASINTNLSRELKKLNLTYSRRNCFILCVQMLILKQYKCNSLRYPPLDGAPFCLDEPDITYYSAECANDCPFQCKSIDFRWSTSTCEYPSFSNFQASIGKDRLFYERVFNTSNVTFDMYKSSLVRIFVYFDRIVTTEITEAPTLIFVDLIANIGGTLGLFIGVSVLSFVEIIELIVDVSFMLFKYYCLRS